MWGKAPSKPRLSYRAAKADGLLGYAVPAAEQAGILRRLECDVDEGAATSGPDGSSKGAWIVRPPSFRPYLIREVDLI